jgi:transketolase
LTGEIKKQNLRVAFLEELLSLAASGKNIVTLDCEVGTATYTTNFGNQYPSRHYELGVAEQNMFGIAAGMASAGLIPFAATFAVFTSMRACEMVRTSICYPRRNVKMIGGYAGLSDGKDGATHHSLEDLAIMRAIPGNTVLVCSDPVMTRKIISKSVEYAGPVYIRIEYDTVPVVHNQNTKFEIGKAVVLRQGTDVTIATIGPAIVRAIEAAQYLEKQGISTEVIDILSLKPFDTETLTESVRKTGALITVEDHNRIGGLASAACEILVNAGLSVKFKALAIDDIFTESGNLSQLRERYGIDISGIEDSAIALCKSGK